ncbi:methyltransferase domain-containing protein [Ectothiorhodospiraceae bacterium WFHF3C12]|nr:methyltransferase domain-containing protein [Ectothiorhodospiraceae bacterium WFHF3C12]
MWPELELSVPNSAVFDLHHHQYDTWFDRHPDDYLSELLAVRALLPWSGPALSIGVGTGRFAAPLGIGIGLDPAREMLRYARARGISVVRGIAEALPFADASFTRILSVTTLCFVDDAAAMLAEAFRALAPGGALVLADIDRASPLGQTYLAKQPDNVFYREARFYSGGELHKLLLDNGFVELQWAQTLTQPASGVRVIEPLQPGHGLGGFMVVRACRPRAASTGGDG